MIFILLRILSTTTFSHLLRYSQARTRRPMTAAVVNYLVAGLFCGAWTWSTGGRWNGATAVLAGVAGFTYVTSLVMIYPAMRRSGVAITGAVLQLSLLVPVAFAVVRFGEMPSRWQVWGIAMTLLALPLLSASRAVDTPGTRSGFSFLTLLLFASAGISQVMMKEFSATRPGSELPFYSTMLFVVATLCTIAWTAATGDTGRIQPLEAAAPVTLLHHEWTMGTLLGVANVLQLVFLILALRALPAVVVFPVSASLGIAVNALVSVVLWKERPPAAGWLGISLAVGAVVLLNIK